MPGITRHRRVSLLDNRVEGRPPTGARIFRGYPSTELRKLEGNWAAAREEAAMRGLAEGLASLEHSQWDWRNKADSVEAGHHLLAEAFYGKCRMTRFGEDPACYDLPYFEHAGRQALDWLASVGGSP